MLAYLERLDVLLGSLPSREQIMRGAQQPASRTYTLHIDRTMPFEWIGSLLPHFTRLWGADVKVSLSDYDASFAAVGGDLQADAFMFWVDWRIYRKSMDAAKAAEWLCGRIAHLRTKTDKSIWVNNWPDLLIDGMQLSSSRVNDRGWDRQLNACLEEKLGAMHGCELIDLAGLAQELAGSLYDERNDQISSFPFTAAATTAIARHIGVHLLPADWLPRLKAIAVDLDDTLYRGVLGEDGSQSVVLTEGHESLQKVLLRLKQSGIMLAICSRNVEEDVRELFSSREDFPLRWEDFTHVFANWTPKAENMRSLAAQLNIDFSAFLFIDDNPAELLAMHAALPSVHLLQAAVDGARTMRMLLHYPALYQLRQDSEAAVRTIDIQANQRRAELRQGAADFESYLSSLAMVLRVYADEPAHAARLLELSRKTNQFNLALRRMSSTEAHQFIHQPEYRVLTFSLKDALADIGIIGAFAVHMQGQSARVIETVFSCRALGRAVEDLALRSLLENLAAQGIQTISFDVVEGPRNAPALGWHCKFIPEQVQETSVTELLARVRAACANHPASVEVIKGE